MLDLDELKKLHDKAYNAGTVTRERAADDMVFYHVTQWDDNLLGESNLQYRGEFNILRKAGRQIVADLRSNPVQVDFEPKNEGRDDAADLLDGLYRSDDRVNGTMEAYDNASGEAVVCGVGAWELYTDYETNRAGDENQVIKRRPLYEANNNVYCDPNAKSLDKSDANYWSILTSYSEDGYKELVKDLTGEEIDNVALDSFKNPEESYTFPWAAGKQKNIYIASFYHRELVKDKVLTMEDPLGQPMLLRESELSEIMDELLEDGYSIVGEKEIKRWSVTKYIASGSEILKTYEIAGENIPVVPMYGERAFVEGEEHYEGITRLAKDPQRLRNFQMSYLADIVSRSPRPKPIFSPEQIQGFEFMFEEAGSENNYPYLLQNIVDANGKDLPIGAVATMPEQNVPTALLQSIELSREAVGDVAPANVSQDIADVDLSGKAVAQLQNRLDEQSIVYQQNRKHALRRDAEIYASMASVVYDAPREVTVTNADGSRNKTKVMNSVLDKETGEMVVLNDLTNLEFAVFADIGSPYATQKEQTIEQLGQMAEAVVQTDPALHKALLLKQLTMIDGVDLKDIREYANKQLLITGIKQPETEEESAMLQQLQEQQANEPQDPNQMIVEAQMKIEQDKVAMDGAKLEQKAQKDNRDAELKEAEFVVMREDNEHEKAVKEIELEIKASEKETTIKEATINANKEIKIAMINAQSNKQRCDTDSEVSERDHDKPDAPQIINIDNTQPSNKTIHIKPTPGGGMEGSISATE